MADNVIQKEAVVSVDAETGAAEQKFSGLIKKIEQPVKLDIDVDVRAMKAQLDEVKKLMDSVTRISKDGKVSLSVSGIGNLQKQLVSIDETLGRLTEHFTGLKRASDISAIINENKRALDEYRNAFQSVIEATNKQKSTRSTDSFFDMKKTQKNIKNIMSGNDFGFIYETDASNIDRLLVEITKATTTADGLTKSIQISETESVTLADVFDRITTSISNSGKSLSELGISGLSAQIIEALGNITKLESAIPNLQQQLDDAIGREKAGKINVEIDKNSIKELSDAIGELKQTFNVGEDSTIGIKTEDIQKITEAFTNLQSVLENIHKLLSSFDIPTKELVNIGNNSGSEATAGTQQVEQLAEANKHTAEAAENAAEKQRQLAEAARETGAVQADGGIVSATGNTAVGEQSIANETYSLDGLIPKLQEVVTAIDAKTNAFRMEGETVDGVVQGEINMLDSLLGEVNIIITDLQKLSEAITALPEIDLKMKEVGEGSTIDSQATENLEKIKNLFENFNSDNITKIGSSISGIKISKATTQNLQDFAAGIELLRETLKSFEGDATSVLGQISDLAAQADGLKALGEAIKSTSSQRTQAQRKLADLGANRITDVDKAWDAAIAENEQVDIQKRITLYNELSESALEYYKLKEKEGKGKATLEETARLTELSKKFEEATANAKKYGDAMSEAEKKAVVGLTKSQNEAQQQIAQNLVSGIQSQIDKMEQTTGRNSAYNAEIDKVKAKYDDLKAFIQTIDWNGDAEAQLAEVKKQVESIRGNIRTANTGREFREANSTRISTLDRRMSEWMNNNSGAGEYLDQVRQLKATLESIGSQAGLDEVSRQFEEIRSNAAEAGKVGKSFGETLKGSFGNLSRYLMTFASFYRIIATLREAVGVVRELDTALTEMRKVSDESLSTLQKYQLESFDMADQVGTTAVQIQNSTADWLRLGRSFEESKSLASLSTKLLNVSEFENIADATKSLVSATQAYDEIDPNAIVDKLNLIGNNYAVSTDELAQGLQNAAAVLKTQGNDLDKALALLTSGNVIGQDISKSSAGIRTISLRIAGTEEAKQEIAD